MRNYVRSFPKARLDGSALEEIVTVLHPIAHKLAVRELEDFRKKGHLPDPSYGSSFLEDRATAVGREVLVGDLYEITDENGIVKSSEPDNTTTRPLPADLSELVPRGTLSFGFRFLVAEWSLDVEQMAPVGASVRLNNKWAPRDADAMEILHAVATVIAAHSDDPEARPPFRVFIGHGGDHQWKVIERLLRESHEFEVQAFESEERVGYSTLETIDMMIRTSAVGVVVMTATDIMADGSARARENVVHEIGYCHGALGIRNTLIVLEDGVSEFSNIHGLTQLRFPKNDIMSVEDKLVEAISLRQRAYEAGS